MISGETKMIISMMRYTAGRKMNMKTNRDHAILISYRISRLTLLLGMACNASTKERVQAQVLIKKELDLVQPLLDDRHIHTACERLDLMQCLEIISTETPSIINLPLDLNQLYDELTISENPAFIHPTSSIKEILSELFVYGHALKIPNVLIRQRSRAGSNYYIDHCGAHPLIFRHARVSLSISVLEVKRWYAHKSWVFLMDDSITHNTKRR